MYEKKVETERDICTENYANDDDDDDEQRV